MVSRVYQSGQHEHVYLLHVYLRHLDIEVAKLDLDQLVLVDVTHAIDDVVDVTYDVVDLGVQLDVIDDVVDLGVQLYVPTTSA